MRFRRFWEYLVQQISCRRSYGHFTIEALSDEQLVSLVLEGCRVWNLLEYKTNGLNVQLAIIEIVKSLICGFIRLLYCYFTARIPTIASETQLNCDFLLCILLCLLWSQTKESGVAWPSVEGSKSVLSLVCPGRGPFNCSWHKLTEHKLIKVNFVRFNITQINCKTFGQSDLITHISSIHYYCLWRK